MKARMSNPVMVIPEALHALMAVATAARKGGLPPQTALLVHLRASQINGCGLCVDMHSRELKKAGAPDERIYGVAAWRESPYFTDAERAALALAEAATRLADRPESVSDEIWDAAARHFDERAMASLLLEIALINAWNRLNATSRQPAGSVPV
jgi:AhpD family alkylhydroperoxidase